MNTDNRKFSAHIRHAWLDLKSKKYFHASIAALCLAFLCLWLILAQSVKTQQETLTQKRNLLIFMQKTAAELQKSGRVAGQHTQHANMENSSSLALTGTVQAEIAHTALAPHILQLRQGENGTIQLGLKQADFDLLIHTLQNLLENAGLTVKDASLTRSEPDGMVSGVLVLQKNFR